MSLRVRCIRSVETTSTDIPNSECVVQCLYTKVVEIFQVIVVNVKGDGASIYFVVRLSWLHNFAVFISTEKYLHMIIDGRIIAGHEEFRGAMSVRVDCASSAFRLRKLTRAQFFDI